ncbi:hypothetical protein [Aquimarina macrocephali]|uniref:hypothetical protein n=1 Tax=Aquimarina macrocephali TaxID=666563 RepID=UPI003F6761DF
MKQFENYFKSRKEVEEYFGNEVFKFSFMCDNIMNFKSLNATFIDSELVVFNLSFYFETGSDFFAYSSFNDWFDKFQLSKITCTSQETYESSCLYFRKYK